MALSVCKTLTDGIGNQSCVEGSFNSVVEQVSGAAVPANSPWSEPVPTGHPEFPFGHKLM